jgi:hypothetical protein
MTAGFAPRPIGRNFCGGSNKPIALTGDGQQKTGLFRIIPEHLADFTDGGIDPVLSVYKDFAVPEALSDFSSGDEVAIPGGQ